MKLHRLYSNRPSLFTPIEFNDGLSAVVAEIRVPENRALDTHNLGKTTVGELIDFCLLKGKKATFFLFKHEAIFREFIFYLELAMPDGTFLTIGRRVDPGSRIDLKRTQESLENAASLSEADWDHYDVAFERGLDLLDGALALDALKPWRFRKLVGYLIRSQRDYQEVFQLRKFSGRHSDWKPFVAHLLGFPAEPVIDLYAKRDELDAASHQLEALTKEWSGAEADPSVLDGLISVKRREVQEKGSALDTFDFQEADRQVTAEVVDSLEAEIVSLNEESYHLIQLSRQIQESLESRTVAFKPEEAAQLFEEAGVLFNDQLTKDFDQLIQFNRAIADERREALEGQLDRSRSRMVEIRDELRSLNEQRAASLAFLRESDALAKYKGLSKEMAALSAELSTLEARREAAVRLVELRQKKRTLSEEFSQAQTDVEEQLLAISSDDASQLGQIRQYFTEIIHSVLGANAILAMKVNSQGGLDFTAEFVDESGVATSDDRGTSYKKLLCIAFDLSVLRARLDVRFPRFVFLDGAFEQLEPRKQEKLLGVLREHADLGLQPIVTLIDQDLTSGDSVEPIGEADTVLTLHDEGPDGLLFHMDPW